MHNVPCFDEEKLLFEQKKHVLLWIYTGKNIQKMQMSDIVSK